MSSKPLMRFQSALISTGMVQPVSENTKGGFLEVLCRQVPGQEKAWLLVVDKLLHLNEEISGVEVDLHICRRYVRKNGQMVFGWNVSINCKSLKKLAASVDRFITEVLSEERPSLHETVRMPPPVAEALPEPHRGPLAPGQHPPPRAAPPRAPGAPGTVLGTPPSDVRLKVVQSSRDEHGKVTIIEEMPLPHVNVDMNIPNSRGRGAKLTGGG
jgi:hypothetical protein